MEASLSSKANRVGTIRSSKWAMGIMAMLLSTSLILSACGGSEGTDPTLDPTLNEPAPGDVPAVPEVPDQDGIDDSEGVTE